MAKSVLHVVPHNGQDWAVKREGNERASSTHATQKEAIEAARELAKELDDIVIHRPDGTIRERVTYYGSNGHAEATAQTAVATTTATIATAVQPQDVMSVGSRVSWEAVLAGTVVAIAAYLTLTLFAVAVGLTARDWIGAKTFNISAAAIAALILLLSLFLGGFVASRATAGENPGEGASYGVLVWGTTFLMLLVGGLGFGVGHLSGLRQLGPAADVTVTTARAQQELGLTDQQAAQYAAMQREARGVTTADTAKAAWWVFVGVLVSMLAAIAGGFVGAGPALALRRAGPPVVAETTAVPRPA
jgi:hypothetical protein